MPMTRDTLEGQRLAAHYDKQADWMLWGPYLSERGWGTVREDYSADGQAWDYLPHDHARSKAFRWNEDGLAGICDHFQRLCFGLTVWNGTDPILKERLFGLANREGNHGEDVKEYYYYLDSTPTHSYMKMLYKYPQAAYPYERLIAENARRGKNDPEFELMDTGIFNESRYFDIFVEYAKSAPEDILIRITAINRGPDWATLYLLPTLWFRNTWAWGRDDYRPAMSQPESDKLIHAEHQRLGRYELHCPGADDILFTENETNAQRLYGVSGPTPYVKDAFHDYLINGKREAVNPARTGTKAAPYYARTLEPGGTVTLRLRLCNRDKVQGDLTDGNAQPQPLPTSKGREDIASNEKLLTELTDRVRVRVLTALDLPSGLPTLEDTGPVETVFNTFLSEENIVLSRTDKSRLFERVLAALPVFDTIFAARQAEADDFYAALQSSKMNADQKIVQRQALAGMLWTKQFYHFDVSQWLNGDPAQPPPPAGRKHGRNREWEHFNTFEVLSMPDKWEYPWFAAWDLAFHCVPFALIDPDFAKNQLITLVREWYQHPNGEVPAYEWNFNDANPPVLAWAAWRIYKIEKKQRGVGDTAFLERVFHKLMLNFTWWVNRKDAEGNNVFQGGFLGLDNIGVFDRSAPLPNGAQIEQSDSTAWMGMFCLNMLVISLELALTNPVYEDIATKFFEHFLYIAAAMNNIGGKGISLWDEQDQFFYDVLNLGHVNVPLKVRSVVGLIPLFAVETVESELLNKLPGFRGRLEWFLRYRPDLASLISRWQEPGSGERRLLALVRGHRMKRLLKRALDPVEFLSDYGIRSLSKYHEANPYVLGLDGTQSRVDYEPAESRTGLFGGNSNWRGPIWFPINYLIIESLQKFHHYYSDDFKVECPTGSGQMLTLDQIADELSRRLIRIFVRDDDGKRPLYGANPLFQNDPNWRDYLLFYEYFHGDSGVGLGANHQTGWTGLVAKLIQQQRDKV